MNAFDLDQNWEHLQGQKQVNTGQPLDFAIFFQNQYNVSMARGTNTEIR